MAENSVECIAANRHNSQGETQVGIKLISPHVLRSHPGQRSGSLRKKRNKEEKRAKLAQEAAAAGVPVIKVLQANQEEVERISADSLRAFSESFRYVPLPRRNSFSSLGYGYC